MLIEIMELLNSNNHNIDMHHSQTKLTWHLPLFEFWHLPLGGHKIEALDLILSLHVSSLQQYKIIYTPNDSKYKYITDKII